MDAGPRQRRRWAPSTMRPPSSSSSSAPRGAGDCIDMNFAMATATASRRPTRATATRAGARRPTLPVQTPRLLRKDVPVRAGLGRRRVRFENRPCPGGVQGKGTCNKATGTCKCVSGFSGDACQRFGCLYDCSGHGQCVSMKKMATMPNALPLSKPATYTGLETTERWDQDRIYGCVCDSSWPVGLGPGPAPRARVVRALVFAAPLSLGRRPLHHACRRDELHGSHGGGRLRRRREGQFMPRRLRQ